MSTTARTITNAAWVDLGAGPLHVQVTSKNGGGTKVRSGFGTGIRVHVGSEAPASVTSADSVDVEDKLNYLGTQNVFAISNADTQLIKVTEVL